MGETMRITRAQATDGRIFEPGAEGWQVVGKNPDALADVSRPLARILRPQAAYRWLLPQLSAITPQYIEMVLRGALAGNHVQQWELFDLMLDTWPELAACAQELTDGVMERKLIFEAFAEEEEDATPTAQERCKLASAALRRMRPDATADENDLDGTIRDILDGWFRGVTCLEVDWQTVTSGVHGQFIAPRATFWVHPVCFAFDQNGRVGLRVDAAGNMQPLNLAGVSLQPQPAVVGAFPQHKFLVGIHKAKSGTALGGSLLRPLAWWWCAANFSADWILNLAQVFGLPFRWANYDPFAPQVTVDAICTMLQNMGSAGWAAFPTGTTLELKEAGKQGSDHSPQGELLDRADRYARLVILGQTMSGSQDSSKGGGKAFGAVESDVKARRINAAAKYACQVLNTQLIPSILTLNYGDADEAPCVRLLEDKEGDLSEAQRDKVLADAGLEIPKGFLRKKYGLPAPVDGEESIGGQVVEEELNTESTEDTEEIDARDLARLAAIEDDALFARELRKLTGEISAMGNSQGARKGWDKRGRGRKESVQIHPALAKALGIEPDKVIANYDVLAAKHPEYFKNAVEAKAYTEHVLSHPTHVLPGNVPENRMVVSLVKLKDTSEPRAVALGVVKRGGRYMVKSAHTLRWSQFQKRVEAAGPGATLGVSTGSLKGKADTRSLAGPHDPVPAAMENIVRRVVEVNL